MAIHIHIDDNDSGGYKKKYKGKSYKRGKYKKKKSKTFGFDKMMRQITNG